MAIRLEKSGELMLIRGMKDEPNPQKEWTMKRRKLGVFLFAAAAATALVFLVPHMPGYEIISNALKDVLAAIW